MPNTATHYGGKKVSVKTYAKAKVKMLKEDFHLRLTKSEVDRMKSMTREIDVDNFAHDLIARKL